MTFFACECLCTAYPLESEVKAGSLLESTTVLSDEVISRNDGFRRAPEIDFRYET